jgi:DNA polymerase-1
VPKVDPRRRQNGSTQYGTLDAVIGHAGEVPGVVGENLRASVDWLPQGKRLLTVKTDCALLHAPTDLALQVADAERLKTLYERFEFKHGFATAPAAIPAPDATRAAAIAIRCERDADPPSTPRCHADRAGARSRGPSTIRGARGTRRGRCASAVPRHYETVLDEAASWRDGW